MQAVWTTIFILTCDKLQTMMRTMLNHFAMDQQFVSLANASLHKVSIMVDHQ